jgi:cell division protein FtsB
MGEKETKMRFSLLGMNHYQWIVIVVLLAMLFLFSDNSIFKRIEYDRQIRDLKSQIEFYRAQSDTNRLKLNELQSNKYNLEKFARENYLMKKDNEEVFIIE